MQSVYESGSWIDTHFLIVNKNYTYHQPVLIRSEIHLTKVTQKNEEKYRGWTQLKYLKFPKLCQNRSQFCHHFPNWCTSKSYRVITKPCRSWKKRKLLLVNLEKKKSHKKGLNCFNFFLVWKNRCVLELILVKITRNSIYEWNYLLICLYNTIVCTKCLKRIFNSTSPPWERQPLLS